MVAVPAALSARFIQAFELAYRLHATQQRKGSGVPYISHLMAVSGLVMECDGTEAEAAAALLHDAVEDQGGAATLEEIRRLLGDEIADIVAGCSDCDVQPKPPWEARKKAYLAHLPAASASIRLVSACDKLHNARTILADYRRVGDALWTRFNGNRDGTLWYYTALVDAYHAAAGPDDRSVPVVDELARVLETLRDEISAVKDSSPPQETALH